MTKKEKLIAKQVEAATKIFVKYVDAIYSNDDLLKEKSPRVSLHQEILNRIEVERMEFYDAYKMLKAHTKGGSHE